MKNYFLNQCLCCGNEKLKLVLDLGSQPLANSYTHSSKEQLEKYPLGLNVCDVCWHSQLTFCVDRGLIFDNYSYVSNTSLTLRHYFKWFAESLKKQLPSNSTVLEIAANDGSLIKEMLALDITCEGIDPARNIVSQASSEGLPIICGYWPSQAEKLSSKYDVIICMNVVAHVDDPKSFILACRSKLKPGGILLIQPSQARMFGNYEFDTCYHEHISFFNTRSMSVLAESAGLKLLDTVLVKIHGDSPIFILCHPDTPPTSNFLKLFRDGDFAIAESLSEYENQIKLFDFSTYTNFSKHAKLILQTLKDQVNRYREQNFDIIFVGAAAKAMTILNASLIKPDRFLDENPMKIGLHAPGIGTLIEGFDVCKQLNKQTFFVITAWNFRHEITAKLRAIGVPDGSVFYSYFPKPEII